MALDLLHGPSKIWNQYQTIVLSATEPPVVHPPSKTYHNYFNHMRNQAREAGIEDYTSAEYIAFLEYSLAEARRVINDDFPE